MNMVIVMVMVMIIIIIINSPFFLAISLLTIINPIHFIVMIITHLYQYIVLVETL